jgi:hypothetical protein
MTAAIVQQETSTRNNLRNSKDSVQQDQQTLWVSNGMQRYKETILVTAEQREKSLEIAVTACSKTNKHFGQQRHAALQQNSLVTTKQQETNLVTTSAWQEISTTTPAKKETSATTPAQQETLATTPVKQEILATMSAQQEIGAATSAQQEIGATTNNSTARNFSSNIRTTRNPGSINTAQFTAATTAAHTELVVTFSHDQDIQVPVPFEQQNWWWRSVIARKFKQTSSRIGGGVQSWPGNQAVKQQN